MSYASIRKQSSSRLEICRKPGLRSWLVFAVLVIGGMGAMYHTPGVTIWTFIYCGLPLILGMYAFEEWEECILDKTSNSVVVQTWNAVERIQYSLHLQFSPNIASAKLSDVTSVGIGDTTIEAVDSFSGPHPSTVCTGYRVVMYLRDGRSLGVTKTSSSGDRRGQEKLVVKIREFLSSFDSKSRDQEQDYSADESDSEIAASVESDTENDDKLAMDVDPSVTAVQGDTVKTGEKDGAKYYEDGIMNQLD